jgi:TRAP-type C4-dicarboxylate transport system permease small subunit
VSQASGTGDDHVLSADGTFDVHDQPVDLKIYSFEDWIALAFFWALAGVVFLQFFTRYALNDSASWTEEIARYLLICTVFVGAAIAVRKNNHVQVDFVYRLLPRSLGRVLSALVDLVRIAFFGYAVYLTAALMMRIGGQPMSVVDWPIGVVYAVVLFGFALMTWRAVQVAGANWRRGASVLERPELHEAPDATA